MKMSICPGAKLSNIYGCLPFVSIAQFAAPIIASLIRLRCTNFIAEARRPRRHGLPGGRGSALGCAQPQSGGRAERLARPLAAGANQPGGGSASVARVRVAGGGGQGRGALLRIREWGLPAGRAGRLVAG